MPKARRTVSFFGRLGARGGLRREKGRREIEMGSEDSGEPSGEGGTFEMFMVKELASCTKHRTLC